MLAKFIQSIFFLSICTTTHGMDTNNQRLTNQWAASDFTPNKNNKKKPRAILTKSQPIAITPKAIPKKNPLPAPQNMQYAPTTTTYYASTPPTNQTYYYPPVMPTDPVYYDPTMAPNQTYYYPYPKIFIPTTENWNQTGYMPHEEGVLHQETEENCIATMYENIKKKARQGDIYAQIFAKKMQLDKSLLKTQEEETSYAYELLDFTNTLCNENKVIITPQEIQNEISELIKIVSNPVAYILTTCQYLHAITDGEKQVSLNNLIQKIDPHTLSVLAQNPLSSIIIEQLKKAPLTASNSCLSDRNLVIAELYYYQGNLEAAHKYYSQNSAAYLNEKSGSLYPFATNACNACLATTTKFYKNDIQYLSALTPNTPLAAQKTNPHISRGIGLLTQARLKDNPNNMDTEKEIAIRLNGIEHLKYAQQHLPCAETMAAAAEFHNALATIYAVNNNGVESLEHLQQALEHGTQINDNPLNSPLLIMLARNAELCTQHAQYSIIIEQLERALLTASNSYVADLNLAIAQLYYYQGNLEAAHDSYSQNSAAYLKEKSGSLYPFATNAFNACLASAENFSKKTRDYLYALTPNLHNTVRAIEKTNPHISYGIGLLAQARIKNNPDMDTGKKIAILENAIEHLEYAQKSMPCNAITAIAAEFHTTLSAIYAVKHDGAASLKHMHHALTCGAQINNDPQANELLAILVQNPELCTQHPQWLAKILNLIYNPCRQQYDDLHKDYAALAQFAECDLAQQLLPYLGDAYRTNNKNKPEIARLLVLLHQHNGDYSKACSYLNFLPHLDEKLMHYFIHTIASQKNMSQILQTIAKKPACTKIINALRAIRLADNNPLLPTINYCLAELSYYSAEYKNAHHYYAQLPKNKLSPTIKLNAFNACIASTETFGKKETQYLSSLNNNINNHLKTIGKIEPKLSYHIGLFTQYLMNNAKLSAEEKTNLMVNGLNHLEYAQKNSCCLTKEKLHNLQALAREFHTSLSTLYEAKNDWSASLKHLCNALAYTSPQNNCAPNREIAAILAQAEEKTPELYKQYASLLSTLVKFITKQPHNAQQKHYGLLSQFASSDLCAQLLPYYEQAYDNTTEKNNIIMCLMALAYKNNGDHTKACDLMDKLSQPTPTPALLLKAEIYTAAQKTLSDSELEAVFTLFTNNKKPSIREQELIVSLMSCNDSFIHTENYTLALKLVTKLAELQPTTAIEFAFYIRKHLIKTKNPYLKEWQKGLHASQLYKKDPSEYDGSTNAAIGALLIEKSSTDYEKTDYEKIIAHFTAALESNDLLPEEAAPIDNTCGILYCNWAETVKHDQEKFSCLLDRAIIKHNSYMACCQKAVFILNTTNNAQMAHHALELFKKIIAADSSKKVESQLAVDSKIALTHAYFNHHPDPVRIPMIQKLIPLNVPKAMDYLRAHNNNESLLKTRRNILAGISRITMTAETHKELIDFTEALKLTELLISLYGPTIDELAQRMNLYSQLNQYEKALKDIESMLNAQDLTNTVGITREKLLEHKMKLLLLGTLNDTTYDHILTCVKQLQACYQACSKDDITINFNASPEMHERTRQIIQEKNMSDKAIEWCCYAAQSHIANVDQEPLKRNKTTTPEERELSLYLLSAAQMGNNDAQLILLPYAEVTHYLDCTQSYIVDILRQTHTALLNPINKDKKERERIVEILKTFTGEGVAFAYYILCDYYKNNPKRLEETMVLFSKAPKQTYYIENKTDIIEKICSSCRDAFMIYVNRYLNNEEKASKIDALAVFTLGSMYQYSNGESLLSGGSFYLRAVKDQLINKFKLPHFAPYINNLLINIYQKQAALADSPTVQLNLHRRCAQLGCLSSIHTIAEMWIQQQNDGDDLEITADEFAPLLVNDIKENNPSNPRSIELFEGFTAIVDRNKKKALDSSAVTTVNVVKPTKTMSVNERMQIIKQHAHENKMVKKINDKEKSQRYLTAIQFHSEGKLEEALAMYKEAANKENHSSAKMMCLINSITGELSANDYTLAEELLNQALSSGLIIKSPHSKAKLFENVSVLNITLCCIESLVTRPHPQPIKSHLLSKIKVTLVKNGIIMAPLHELLEKITGIKLDSVLEWKTDEEICNETHLMMNGLNAINNALDTKNIPALRTEVYSLMNIVNSDNNNGVTVANVATAKKSLSPNETMALIKQYACKNNMINHIDYKERNKLQVTGLTHQHQENLKEANVCYRKVLKKENHANASIMLLFNELANKNYAIAVQLLTQALSYGIVKSRDNKTNQFHNPVFFNTFFSYIEALITNPHPQEIKQQLLSIIKDTLVKNGFMTNFCNIFATIEIDLKAILEWKTAEEIKNSLSPSPSEVNILHDHINKACTIAESKINTINDDKTAAALLDGLFGPSTISPVTKIIKDPEYRERNPAFLNGLKALERGDTLTGYNLLHDAALQHHPGALITLASFCLVTAKTNETYKSVKDLLIEALSCGLEEDQFSNPCFVRTLCCLIKNLFTDEHPSSVRQELSSIIRKKLETNNVNRALFYETVLNATKLNLPAILEWQTDEENQAHAILNRDDAVNNALDEKNTPVLRTKVNSPMNSVNNKGVAAAKKPSSPKVLSATEVMDFIQRYAREKKMIKHEKYTEKSPLVIAGMVAENQGNSNKAVALYGQAPHNPIASISLAVYSLAENDITKNYPRVEKLLTHALSCILVQKSRTDKSKQFHNVCSLNSLLEFICMLTEPELEPIKEPLLSIIKTTFTRDGINTTYIRELFEKTRGRTFPEWKTAEEISNTLSSDETRSLRDELNKICDSLPSEEKFEYQEYKETSHYFAEAKMAYQLDQIPYAVNLMRVAITQEHHPLACLALAKHFIGKTKINYPVLDDLLDQSFKYSFEKNQFKTEAYLHALGEYITIFLSKNHPPLVKQRFFSKIKNALKQNTMSNENFCTIILKKTNLNLRLDPDWNTNNNKPPIPIIFSSGNICEDMELLKALTGSNSYSSSTKTTATTTSPIKKSWINNADYKETCSALLFALDAHHRGQPDIALGLMKSAAEKNHSPLACMFLASHYSGKEKNYKTSEHFLRLALLYGLKENQFCNQDFLNGFCTYIKCVTTGIDSSAQKQSLLAPIKTALILNKFDLTELCPFLKEKFNIDLLLIPEWQTESEIKQELNVTYTKNPTDLVKLCNLHDKKPATKNLINDTEYEETCEPFLAARQAYNKGEVAKGDKLMTIAAEQNHPVACICHASGLLKTYNNYPVSEKFLQRALELGIENNQLCNYDFLTCLCYYIVALMAEDHPREIKQRFLSIIRRTLESKGINMEAFYKAFQAARLGINTSINFSSVPDINLYLLPEWNS